EDLESHRQAEAQGLRQDLANHSRADALPLELRKQGDVPQEHVVWPALDRKHPRVGTVDANDLARGVAVMLFEEALLKCLVPSPRRLDRRAHRLGLDEPQQLPVVLAGEPQVDHAACALEEYGLPYREPPASSRGAVDPS